MVRKEVFLTEEGRQGLEEELDRLVSVRRREVAARIHKANETGGTVDNAEYDEAKNEQAFLEGRISDLDNILSNAVVAPPEKGGGVQLGSTVAVAAENGSKRDYRVVGSAEAAPLEGKISHESPVGMALMDHKVGDRVEAKTPAGAVKLKITKIR
jgi:transcription elongation factor GreA